MKKKMMRINYKLTDLQNFLYLKSSLIYVDIVYICISFSLAPGRMKVSCNRHLLARDYHFHPWPS